MNSSQLLDLGIPPPDDLFRLPLSSSLSCEELRLISQVENLKTTAKAAGVDLVIDPDREFVIEHINGRVFGSVRKAEPQRIYFTRDKKERAKAFFKFHLDAKEAYSFYATVLRGRRLQDARTLAALRIVAAFNPVSIESLLAWCYQLGVGTAASNDKAKEHFSLTKQSSLAAISNALEHIPEKIIEEHKLSVQAFNFANSSKEEKDYFKYLHKSAEWGSSLGKLVAGIFYLGLENDIGICRKVRLPPECNSALGLKCINEAADAGDLRAEFVLGRYLVTQTSQLATGMGWLEKSADCELLGANCFLMQEYKRHIQYYPGNKDAYEMKIKKCVDFLARSHLVDSSFISVSSQNPVFNFNVVRDLLGHYQPNLVKVEFIVEDVPEQRKAAEDFFAAFTADSFPHVDMVILQLKEKNLAPLPLIHALNNLRLLSHAVITIKPDQLCNPVFPDVLDATIFNQLLSLTLWDCDFNDRHAAIMSDFLSRAHDLAALSLPRCSIHSPSAFTKLMMAIVTNESLQRVELDEIKNNAGEIVLVDFLNTFYQPPDLCENTPVETNLAMLKNIPEEKQRKMAASTSITDISFSFSKAIHRPIALSFSLLLRVLLSRCVVSLAIDFNGENIDDLVNLLKTSSMLRNFSWFPKLDELMNRTEERGNFFYKHLLTESIPQLEKLILACEYHWHELSYIIHTHPKLHTLRMLGGQYDCEESEGCRNNYSTKLRNFFGALSSHPSLTCLFLADRYTHVGDEITPTELSDELSMALARNFVLTQLECEFAFSNDQGWANLENYHGTSLSGVISVLTWPAENIPAVNAILNRNREIQERTRTNWSALALLLRCACTHANQAFWISASSLQNQILTLAGHKNPANIDLSKITTARFFRNCVKESKQETAASSHIVPVSRKRKTQM